MMYNKFFQLKQAPFSIAPDPSALYLSPRHREALAHLVYGARSDGGIVLLTGEIGAGKTTVCRCFIEKIPARCNVAYIFNPKLSALELLHAICEEFHLMPQGAGTTRPSSLKQYIDLLNSFLLHAHAQGRSSMLIIDEAQNLAVEVLEQLRLLTNLETNTRKLLQVVLIGQPELREKLARPELEQLSQRVIARYHLGPLSEEETEAYIRHRLAAAGMLDEVPFKQTLVKRIHRLTEGIPRRINLLCDRALLGAYVRGTRQVDRKILDKAASELSGMLKGRDARGPSWAMAATLCGVAAASVAAAVFVMDLPVRSLLPFLGTPSVSSSAEAAPPPSAMAVAESAPVPGEDMPELLSKADMVPPEPAPTSNNNSTPTSDEAKVLRIDSEYEAVRQLAALWNVELGADAPCVTAEERGLRCYEGKAGFAELRRLDRPAVMRLLDADQRPYYVLLTGLEDADATLRVGNTVHKVPAVLLAQRFRGEFITLWRSPPGKFDLVRTGRTGPEVDWIAQQLSTLYSTPHPPAGTPFAGTIRQQLIEFQRAEGLLADGTAGPVTLMRLNRAVGIDEPRLQGKALNRATVSAGSESAVPIAARGN